MMSACYPPSNSYQLASVENRIFVGGLSLGATESDLWSHFLPFGCVLRVDMPLGRSGEKKGFAIVHFEDSNAATRALGVRVHEIRGKRVAVRRALDSAEASMATKSMQEKKVFASGFPYFTTEEEVFQLFSHFGKILKILSPKGGVGKRGFCYVIMKDKEDFEYLVTLGELALHGCRVSVQRACTKHLLNDKPVFKSRNTQTPTSQPAFTGRPQHSQQDRSLLEQEAFPSSSRISGPVPGRPRARATDQHRLAPNSLGRDEPPYRPTPHSLGSSSPPESAPTAYHNSHQPLLQTHLGHHEDGREPVLGSAHYSGAPQEGLRFRVNSRPLAYEFRDKYTSKKNLNHLTGILPGLDPHERVEVEIVQDINTVVTIRDKQKTSAIKAIFEEQAVYLGSF